MLIQKSVSASVDNSFLFNSHLQNQRYSFDWMLGDHSLKRCSHFGDCVQDIGGNLVSTAEKNSENLVSTAEKNSENLVSKAEKNSENLVSTAEKNSENLVSKAERNSENLVSTAERNNENLVSTAEKNSENLVSTAEKNSENVVSTAEKNSENLVSTAEKNRENSSPLSLPSYAHISTHPTMPARSTPLNVYRRKKLRKPPSCPPQGSNHPLADGSNPAVSSESLNGATNAFSVNVEKEGFQSSLKLSEKCRNEGIDSKSGSCNDCPDFVEPCSNGSLRSDTGRGLDHCSVDDSCSSSKINGDIISGALKTEVDDTCECSSSGMRDSEGMWDNMSEKDILISIMKNMGLLEMVQQDQASADKNDMTTESRKCRVCDCSDSTLKMLICDQCEDAFHPSCCNPRIRRIPIHEWFCNSCIKKKRKLLVEKKPSSSESINNGSSRSNVELSPITSMLMETGPYRSKVRLGLGFQAEVPTWFGPAINEIRSVDECAKEMMESEYLNLGNSIRTFSSSSVGNWLQCRAVIRDAGDGTDKIICGKWRRAPLFEVQTDNWECFCAVLWDPLHADCAVSQELSTDEVLKQIKYIETLRPRLAAAAKKRKKRKLDVADTVGSQDSKQA